ncbi:hypothetical protein GT755_11650 [Herbidospora sp. NEAU-GS84]|uniref:Uncharacterized protein n=1 Tax=Herbidospora solisilvae TaxID=2696284 RepID=A0A7C9NZX1_9ACTN|nr:hypothetical protein [Herbidospora solisilvae]NAS22337.1 hypothetical protein [Herbidospora solisilvae]
MGDARGERIDCAVLLAKLDSLYRKAGRPSYGRMSELARTMISAESGEEWRPLSTSHLSNIMKGRFTRLPGWPLIRTIVTVLYKFGTMNGRMEASPQAISTLTQEFAEVWDAIETRDAPARPVAQMPYVPGDILEQAPEEVRLPPVKSAAFRMPRAWGRIGASILRRAEQGDAGAAYQIAVLLACEATREELTPAYRRLLLEAAAEWKKEATGTVAEALNLRLHGPGLLRAAGDLAFRRPRPAKRNVIFIQAFLHAEASLQKAAIPDDQGR